MSVTHVVVSVSAVLPLAPVALPVLLLHLDLIADAVTSEPAVRRATSALGSHRNAYHSRLGVFGHTNNTLSYTPVASYLD